MGFTKILVTSFLLVILVVSMSSQNAMASEIKATINGQKCISQCIGSYDNYKCSVDCIALGYVTGGCRTLYPSEPPYCCCYKL
ncbi:PREDICTED: defensin-like protein 50 [Camelina sativa]|uniref:Defensin-like protein 50 n=1 Tax=Camelina sativa TaxID=90675 RepID=A0ABM1RKZ5_CAMSA|nr:PREDICTED: defensin-like protein 50 [Camelina sativa]